MNTHRAADATLPNDWTFQNVPSSLSRRMAPLRRPRNTFTRPLAADGDAKEKRRWGFCMEAAAHTPLDRVPRNARTICGDRRSFLRPPSSTSPFRPVNTSRADSASVKTISRGPPAAIFICGQSAIIDGGELARSLAPLFRRLLIWMPWFNNRYGRQSVRC